MDPTATQQKKSGLFNIFIGLLVISIIIALVVSIFIFFSSLRNKESQDKILQTAPDLLIYQNIDFDFRFEYPVDWVVLNQVPQEFSFANGNGLFGDNCTVYLYNQAKSSIIGIQAIEQNQLTPPSLCWNNGFYFKEDPEFVNTYEINNTEFHQWKLDEASEWRNDVVKIDTFFKNKFQYKVVLLTKNNEEIDSIEEDFINIVDSMNILISDIPADWQLFTLKNGSQIKYPKGFSITSADPTQPETFLSDSILLQNPENKGEFVYIFNVKNESEYLQFDTKSAFDLTSEIMIDNYSNQEIFKNIVLYPQQTRFLDLPAGEWRAGMSGFLGPQGIVNFETTEVRVIVFEDKNEFYIFLMPDTENTNYILESIILPE